MFLRRMVGYYLCQKIFYRVCTVTWILIGVEKGRTIQRYQDALIENVFQTRNKDFFLDNQKTDTSVRTFDGQFQGFLAWEELERIVSQVCVLGPIAGVYGRLVEQFLINPKRKNNCYIPERIFIKSVDEARVSLKKEWLYEAPKRPTVGESDSDTDDNATGPTVEKQMENLRMQIQHNENGVDVSFNVNVTID